MGGMHKKEVLPCVDPESGSCSFDTSQRERRRQSPFQSLTRALMLSLSFLSISLVAWAGLTHGIRLERSILGNMELVVDPRTTTAPPNPASAFSFDIDAARHCDWMAGMPDNVSLSALSIPGTHDTMTHRLGATRPTLQCQNYTLATQLDGGVRYIDIRARLNATLPPVPSNSSATGPGNLLIYHSNAWTGYSFADVMETVFSFLDAHPSEAVLMRLKREGPAVHVGPDGQRLANAPTAAQNGGVDEDDPATWKTVSGDPMFEAAFNYHRLQDPRLAEGFAKHFYSFPSNGTNSTSVLAGGLIITDGKRVPTLGQARGKVVMLQDFDGAKNTRNVYGLPWDEMDPRLRIEDLWILTSPPDLDRKWAAVKAAMQAAAAETPQNPSALYLSHLSASVGVTPIEVAAGVRDPTTQIWYEGINDRTGKWLEERTALEMGGKSGVLLADFPGKRLVDAIIARNKLALSL